ncbi:MAG TPA: helicase-associated domain-containing protein, partial [Anaerolineales bacterium]|nr:helicase-associated domain-containing protein [Anaerolineales bacterium]
VRQFLETRRGEALLQLYKIWGQSDHINELRQLPGLILEGKWKNDPLHARQAILGWLTNIAAGTWWNLSSFISSIKLRAPDFQRPAGDYDSWFIKDEPSGEYLRGFEHWDEVDGKLIRYLLTGPLHWLGVIDLACPEEGQEVAAFRLSGWSKTLFKGEAPRGLPLEKEPVAVRSDARISAKRLTPRSVRYQLARFCDWEKETLEEYQYRVNPASLLRARQQGLKVSQLVALLNKSAKAVPPSLVKALERWDKQGSEARLEKMLVLRVASEELLQALRRSRVSRFLGEPLGPTSIAVKPRAMEKILGALAEMGYLGEIREAPDEN